MGNIIMTPNIMNPYILLIFLENIIQNIMNPYILQTLMENIIQNIMNPYILQTLMGNIMIQQAGEMKNGPGNMRIQKMENIIMKKTTLLMLKELRLLLIQAWQKK
jgi:hypothetical protein